MSGAATKKSPVAAPLLDLRDLRVTFEAEDTRVEAVRGASLRIQPGEIHGLAGESGSGKSVTGLTLMGLTRAEAGSISGTASFHDTKAEEGQELDLIAASAAELRQVRGNRIAMIFQDPLSSLNPFHRIGNQITEAIRAHRQVERQDAARRAIDLLGEVGIPRPDDRSRDFPHQFSGGMRQRVMIAMALANEPELLIADEPTTALDVTTQAQILDLIEGLRERHGMAVLLITHDLGVIAERAERVSVMRKGEMVESGTVADVYRRPAASYTRELLAAVPRVDRAGSRPTRPPGAGHAEGVQASAGTAPLLEVSELRRSFAQRRRLFRPGASQEIVAVDGVSLTVEAGETVGLVGESGSGKSTLCRLIAGLIAPDQGSVRFAGTDLSSISAAAMRRQRAAMQMIFQDPYSSLNPRHRVDRIVAEPMRIHGVASGAELRRRAGELLERVGLEPGDGRRYPHEFSGGQRQRIGIARALSLDPKLILADEPVSALDVSIQAQILELMNDLQKDLGLAYLFVSHDLGVVRQVSDRIAVMRDGRIVEEGPAEKVCSTPADPYTRELLAAVPLPQPGRGAARSGGPPTSHPSLPS